MVAFLLFLPQLWLFMSLNFNLNENLQNDDSIDDFASLEERMRYGKHRGSDLDKWHDDEVGREARLMQESGNLSAGRTLFLL